jgi:hypothetical protein
VRVVQQFEVLREYLLKGKFDSKTKENDRFKRICAKLQANKVTLLRLQFVVNVAKDFEQFLTLFQDPAPLIHLLHDEMTELVRSLLMRFVKRDLIAGKSARSLVSVVETQLKAENYLHADTFDIGCEAGQILKQMKADKAQYSAYKSTIMDITKFFEKISAYMVKKLPLSNVLLKNTACLSPLCRQVPSSVQMIIAVVENLPYLHTPEMKDNVRHEWQKYQDDQIPEDFYISDKGQKDDGTPYIASHQIDHYWHKIMSLTDSHGNQKYPNLSAVVKIISSLAHGQADVERGFSVIKQVLDSRIALSQQTLIGVRAGKEDVARHDSIVTIPITPSLLTAYRNAHKVYKDALQLQKSEKAQDTLLRKRKLPLENEVAQLQTKKREWQDKQCEAEKLINEGTERLSAAVQSGKIADIRPSQALLESGNKLWKECRSEIDGTDKQLQAGQHQPTKSAK